ncbi:MAG TPA: TRAP transporter fused permease subunit [Methylomirabilota bacterium]|nr:TRAP transporter fused permease subunit [Methylomirabilota bacterium]
MADATPQARRLTGAWHTAAQLMLGGVSLYFLWATSFGVVPLQYFRGIAVLYSLVLPLLLYGAWRKSRPDRPTVVDLALVVATVVSIGYWIVEHEQIAYRAGAYTELDFWMGVVLMLVSIEAARRVLGWGMAMCAVLPMAYALFGAHLPFVIGHRGFTLRRIVEFVYLSSDGIFGVMADVVAGFILPFVVFGAFMEVAGVARFFVDLSLAVLGRIAGGPAQAAVISSLFMGTVSGSPIAETVTTGTVTIPLMKRTGFPAHIAAAVEGAASTGAMAMPPVMGAGAFIMAEMTGISYLEIIKVAAIPGILFYLSVAIMVYFESRKLGLRGLRADELPRFGTVLKRGWYFFIPILVLMTALIWGWAPGTSAVFGIVTAIVLSWLVPGGRLGPARVWEALVEGGKASLFVAALTGAVGILIGVLALTGIGIRFSYVLVDLAGGSLPLTLLLLAVSTLVLGLALPITATYLMVAVVAVPVLADLGLPLLTAHLIILWLALDANITPPVALGPFAAAAIAEADPMRTGWSCFRFAKSIYLMPVLMAYTHLLFTGTPTQNVMAVLSATLGTMLFSILSTAFFVVRLTVVEFVVFALATVLAFIPFPLPMVAAIALFAGLFFWQRRRARALSSPRAAARAPG